MSMINPNSLARLSFTVDAGAKTLDIGVKAPFKMWLPDPSAAGSYVHKTITAPATINGDGHASENFNTGEAGQTLANAWGEDYPLTWYLTIESGDIYWVASRNPCMTQMPAAAGYIGDFSAEPATATTLQTNVFIAASVTVADFVDLPVWPIGTMPVQRAAASQIPTLVALTAGRDGAGLWNEQTQWTMPVGQNDCADASEVFDENGAATTLNFGTISKAFYVLDRKGWQHVTHVHASGVTNGSGAGVIRWFMPYVAAQIETIDTWFLGTAYFEVGNIITTGTARVAGSTSHAFVNDNEVPAGSTPANGFSDADDNMFFNISTPVF